LRHTRGDALLENALAGVPDFPGDLGAGRLDDTPGRLDALGADAVAGDEGDEFRAVGGRVHGRGWLLTGSIRVVPGGMVGFNGSNGCHCVTDGAGPPQGRAD